MRVFVTGATGFISSIAICELHDAGCDVLGQARGDDSTDALAQQGVEAHRGGSTNTDSPATNAWACESMVYLASVHDFANHWGNGDIDRRAAAAVTDVLEGSGRPLVITSGMAVVSPACL